MKPYRLATAFVFALILFGVFSASASAQTVNRTNVPAGEAEPTGGTFSVRFPTAFSDIEARAKALASQCLAAASKEGIPASEIGEAIDDLADYMMGAIEEAEDREEHAHRPESNKEAAELVDPDAIEDAEEDAREDEEDEEDDEDDDEDDEEDDEKQ